MTIEISRPESFNVQNRSNKLLLATSNAGKLAELRQYLAESRIEVIGLADLPPIPPVEETGSTFRENADLKAAAYSRHAGLPALADDSGLEVMALDGRPGVLSARYGGEDLSYKEKMIKLLREMGSSVTVDRSARFVCAMSLSSAECEIIHRSEGICEGTIAHGARGAYGFGYDPIFIPRGYELTFGELSESVKRAISHRARAIQEIIPFLQHFNID